jgi:hypothetical protein
MRVARLGGTAVQDHVALAEIELYGNLVIAASASAEDRLSLESIDEVLGVSGASGVSGVPGASGVPGVPCSPVTEEHAPRVPAQRPARG